jgi:hypothetical protein
MHYILFSTVSYYAFHIFFLYVSVALFFTPPPTILVNGVVFGFRGEIPWMWIDQSHV